jgi:hypothetical protein
MKKVYVLLILLFSLTAFTFGQQLENSVSAVHKDVTSATSAVYTDASKATAAVYQDATTAVGTIHQDLKDIATTTYPDAKGVITTLYSDGKRAIDYLVPKVESVISALATGLKTTTAEVWRILVYKQVALGVTALIYFLVALLLIIIYAVGVNKTLKTVGTMNGYWSGAQTAFVVIGGVIAGCLLIFTAIQIPVMVNGFIVPEAGALKEAVGLTQQLIGTFK